MEPCFRRLLALLLLLTLPATLTSITIPDGVTSLGDAAFYSCTSLTNVTLPNGVTNIGGFAFANCTSLTGITVPGSVTSIGEGAFDNCTALTTLRIPDSVTSIGGGAFYSCINLASVTLGNSVASLGGYAFYGCSRLTAVNFRGDAPSTGTSVFSDGSLATVYYLPGTSGWGATFGGLPAALWNPPLPYNYTIDGGTVTIIQYTGPDGAAAIPGTIEFLPVTRLGDNAFAWCTSLTNVTIPESVTSIGSGAFSACTSLTSITIPGSVTRIGDNAFYYCTRLAAITVDEFNPAYASVDGVLFDKAQTTLIQFPAGKAATAYTIPDGVGNIGNQAFIYCANLASVTIPDGVTNIGLGAFAACAGLTNATISGSVTSLGNFAFYYCSTLTGVYFRGDAPSIGSDVFSNTASNATVYYLPGTSGWGATFGGLPAVLWNPQVPYTYTTDNGMITITGYTGPGGAVTIPSTINFLPVTSIGNTWAFSFCV